MARRSFYATLGTALANGDQPVSSSEDGADIVTALAALSAAIATLVADAATPTQAHVTAANTALTNYNAALARKSDLVLDFNAATVTTVTQLRRLADQTLRQALGNGIVLA